MLWRAQAPTLQAHKRMTDAVRNKEQSKEQSKEQNKEQNKEQSKK